MIDDPNNLNNLFLNQNSTISDEKTLVKPNSNKKIYFIFGSIILIVVISIFSYLIYRQKINQKNIDLNNKIQQEFNSQIANGNFENISKLTQLSPNMAKIIVDHYTNIDYKPSDGYIIVPGSVDTPYDIPPLNQNDLPLNGLTSISVETIKELLNYKSGILYLNGLTSITPEIAQELAKYQGGLSLDGLTSITPEIAQELAKLQGYTSVKQLKEFERLVTETKKQTIGIGVYLNGNVDQIKIESPIPNSPAERYGIKSGDVITRIINKSKNIDIDTSRYSSDQIGGLMDGPLGGEVILTIFRKDENEDKYKYIEITVPIENVTIENPLEIAKTTEMAKKSLSLNGLKKIDSNIVDKLINIKGKYDNLSLNGIANIDKDIAQKLATHSIVLHLGLTSITPEITKELASCFFLILPKLDSISPESAKELIKMQLDDTTKEFVVKDNIQEIIKQEYIKMYQESYKNNN